MATDLLDSAASVTIAGDRLSAELRLLPGADASCLTPAMLLTLLDAKGIARAMVDLPALDALAGAHRADNAVERCAIVARGTAPTHGVHGRFELDAALAADAARARGEHANEGDPPGPKADALDAVSFYQQSRYVVVEAGQVLGRVVPPVEGVDGVDVTGASLAAKTVGAFLLMPDPSIEARPDGVVIALFHGRLDETARGVRVVRELVVDDSIDFSTGNIDFPGDVVVRRGIKDCFEVAVGGNLRVQELVEAARIECGGDCVLDRGMSGRGKGDLRVGGTLSATFVSDARVDVARDLCLSGEARECVLSVGRAIRSPRAAILGGVASATVEAELAQLGGEGEVPTELVIGHAPTLQDLARRIGELIPRIRVKADEAQRAHDELAASAPRPTAAQKERLQELQFAAMNGHAKIAPLEAAIDELARSLSTHAKSPSVIVHRAIFPKCVVVLGPWRIEVENPIKGPVRVVLGSDGAPALRHATTGAIRPWTGLARVMRDDRFAALPAAFWSRAVATQPAA